MTEEIQAAIDAIRAAFPPHPLSPDSAPDEWVVMDTNPSAFMALVRGKSWDELPSALLERHHDALAFLKPIAFVEVLPAFLVTTLRDDPDLHMVPYFVAGALTRDVDTARNFDMRVASLSRPQISAIAKALAAWERSPEGAFFKQLIAKARDSYWRAKEES